MTGALVLFVLAGGLLIGYFAAIYFVIRSWPDR